VFISFYVCCVVVFISCVLLCHIYYIYVGCVFVSRYYRVCDLFASIIVVLLNNVTSYIECWLVVIMCVGLLFVIFLFVFVIWQSSLLLFINCWFAVAIYCFLFVVYLHCYLFLYW